MHIDSGRGALRKKLVWSRAVAFEGQGDPVVGTRLTLADRANLAARCRQTARQTM
jgi:hypothetical protein